MICGSTLRPPSYKGKRGFYGTGNQSCLRYVGEHVSSMERALGIGHLPRRRLLV